MKPNERKDFFEGRLKDAIPGVNLLSVTITPENVLDTSVPLSAEIKFTASGLTANGDHKSIVNLPWISKNLGVANRILLDVVGLKERKYPLNTELTCGVREDVSLKLEGGFGAPLSVPEFSSIDDHCVAYKESVNFANDTLTCSRDFRLKTVEFSPDEYLQLRQTLTDMDFDRRKSLILALNSKSVKEASTVASADDTAVQSSAKLLYSQKSLAVTDAHTAVYHVKYSKLILTYDGKIRESDMKINYNPACEEARIVRAVVISKDGSQQEISTNEISAMDQGWDAGARRYTAGKILVASLPGVDIGSTIEVEYEIKMKDVPFVAGFEPFQFPDDLAAKSFTLTAPAGLPIQSLISGPKGIVQEQHRTGLGMQTFRWQAKDVKALPEEPNLPPIWSFQSGVSFFVGHAADYWKSLDDVMTARAGKSGNAAKLAQKLTASAKTKLDAVKAIRDFIAENIRVAGPSFTELPLSELSDADTTLSDGYGHVADCAILYYAMLKAAGFQPEFIMASGLPPVAGITDVTKSFPLPNDFQMSLVKVTVQGADYYLNDTDQYAQLGTTASDGKLGIALADQKLITIHAAKDCSNKIEIDYTMSLSSDGKAQIQISRWFYGENYNGNNEFFSELPPEEREHYFQETVSHVAQGARAVGDLTTKFDTYPGLERFTVEMDHFGIPDGKYFYFNLPYAPTLFGTLSEQRELPLYFPDAGENILRAEIQLPPGFQVTDIGPKNQKFTAPGGSQARITRTDADGKTTVISEFELTPGIIKPKNYPALLDIQSALGSRSGTTFLLEREN